MTWTDVNFGLLDRFVLKLKADTGQTDKRTDRCRRCNAQRSL